MLDFDIDKMCRICLQSNIELYLLFDEQNAIDGVFLSNIISDMTIFKIQRHDDFPHQICSECMHGVRNAYELKKKFEQSHRKLLTYLESINKITIDTTAVGKNDKCVQTEYSTIYPCEKCDDKFITSHSLRQHRLVVHKGTADICRFCFKKFNRIGDLKSHIAVRHPEKQHFNSHDCVVCYRKFTRKHHLTRHMWTVHRIVTEQNFADEDNILNQIKSDTNELEMLIETETDSVNLTNMENTSDMFLSKESEDYHDESIGLAAENPFSSDEDDKPLAGLRKEMNAKNKDSQNILIKVERDDSQIVDPYSASKSEEIKTGNKDDSLTVEEHTKELTKKFECSICLKEFKRSSHLKQHYFSHVIEKPFPCKICDNRFSRADELKSHMSKHNDTKAFKCNLCDLSYNRPDFLRRHKEKKHFGSGQFGIVKSEHCQLCNKSFSTKSCLQKHMSKHTNKSWKCKLCLIGFESKEALTEHNKSHAKDKTFLCSECGKSFVKNDNLLTHMRRHTGEKPFKCKYCDKGFTRAADLNVHVKYHTGEKTHLCTICGKGFQRSYNLVVHMRVHTGERPYQCSYCPRNFTQGHDLKVHIRRHTGERYKCELCGAGYVLGYLLTQHKISVHGVDGEARKGRVSKVKPNKSIIEDISEHKEDSSTYIKSEPESCKIFDQPSVKQEALPVELNLNNL